MKANRFVQILAAAAVICGVVLMSSCEKEPLLPEVIESEVYDNGSAEEVMVTPTSDGQSLSYESWMMVRGVTKGAFANRVSVTLNASMPNVTEVRDVAVWDFGTSRIVQTREAGESRTEGFVTITDSVLVYTVITEEFEFSYRLHYEVGVYDDGVTRQVMPYHYFGNIRDNGGVTEAADSYVDGDYAYARRIFRHSISVEFGGETYEVKAEVTLRRALGAAGASYVVRSEVTEKSVTAKSEGDGFLSTITVRSLMSTGEEREETYSAELPVGGESNYARACEPDCAYADVRRLNMTLEPVSESWEEYGKHVTLKRISENCVVHYNAFDLEIPFYRYGALFDNGVLIEEMACCEYDPASASIAAEDWNLENETASYESYRLNLEVSLPIGSLTAKGKYSGKFYFYE